MDHLLPGDERWAAALPAAKAFLAWLCKQEKEHLPRLRLFPHRGRPAGRRRYPEQCRVRRSRPGGGRRQKVGHPPGQKVKRRQREKLAVLGMRQADLFEQWLSSQLLVMLGNLPAYLIGNLPFPIFEFTTPAEERARLAAEGEALYRAVIGQKDLTGLKNLSGLNGLNPSGLFSSLLTFTAASGYSPGSPPPQQIYYQVLTNKILVLWARVLSLGGEVRSKSFTPYSFLSEFLSSGLFRLG